MQCLWVPEKLLARKGSYSYKSREDNAGETEVDLTLLLSEVSKISFVRIT